MNKNNTVSTISVYSLSHALIDAACAATLFAFVTLGQREPQLLFDLVVLYDVLAFALQPLFGLMVDRFNAPVQAAVLGTVLVAAAALLPFPFLATVAAGIGNALFHVGGGVISLNLAPGRAALPGIYVAPGALGLMIGTLIGKSGGFVAWPFVLLLLISALLFLALPRPGKVVGRALPGELRWFETVILLLLFSVAIRGVVGLSLVLPWKSDRTLLVALTSVVVVGKALGGILGDRFGWSKVALSGLVIAAPLLAFFTHIPYLVIAGAFFFNLTMPITLTCLAAMLPGKSGFAFGLTTLALIIGAGPTFTPLGAATSQPAFIVGAILISTAALYAGLKLYGDHFADRTA